MCGICGVIGGGPDARRAVETMTERLRRRGPDDTGTWSDPSGMSHLGFRRLSVIDRSPSGAQPMISRDGRHVLVFNGELYDHRALGRRLEDDGAVFRGTSDTEVVLELLSRRGRAGLTELNGMFGLALFGRDDGDLLLARDHAGIKPLWWAQEQASGTLAFCSQYDLLFATGWIDPGDIVDSSLAVLLELQYLPAPHSLHSQVHQVEPGGWLERTPDGTINTGRWWELPERTEPILDGPEADEAMAASIGAAVSRQQVADVPLGVFLSSGVDSPLVAANAALGGDGSLDAFTISTSDWSGDEGAGAARIAAHLGLRHHSADTADLDPATIVSEALDACTEPFGDHSMVPTGLVSRLARDHVTVALSGDGGDELCFGYERPRSLLDGGERLGWPKAVRRAHYRAARLGLGSPPRDVVMFDHAGAWYRQVHGHARPGVVESLVPSVGPERLDDDLGIYGPPSGHSRHELCDLARRAEFRGQLQRVLKKVDMASMHHSLEVRVPLLDTDVIATSLLVDPEANLAGGGRKEVLTRLLGQHVPVGTVDDIKRGFAAPTGEWLGGPLAPMVRGELLERPDPTGLVDPHAMTALVEEHLEGGHRSTWVLFTLLSLRRWFDRIEKLHREARK